MKYFIFSLVIVGIFYYVYAVSHTPSLTTYSSTYTPSTIIATPIPSTPTKKSFSVSGYVAYITPIGMVGCGILPDGSVTHPCSPEYDFLILSDEKKTLDINLDTMTGLPSVEDLRYTYVSFKGFDGEFPSTGDKVMLEGEVYSTVVLHPPKTFPMLVTRIKKI